jgi:eukaryotic-like serine/threonine-protein kinase
MDPEYVAADPRSSPTMTLSPTGFGVILGTAGYMSPEQARGLPADKRADVWSFGVVLCEMLTGARTFAGETVSDTLAAVLRADLDWAALPADTPASIRRLLRRCLERDRKKRLRDIGDALLEIDEATTPPATEAAPPATRRERAFWIAALVVSVAGVALWAWLRSPALPGPRPVMRWTTTLPLGDPFTSVTMSPAGLHLAYFGMPSSGSRQLLLRPLDQLEAKPLVSMSLGPAGLIPANPVWFSPDGRWIGYFDTADRKLKKVPVTGGAPISLCALTRFRGASWGTDDNIIFTDNAGGLSLIPAAGGQPQAFITPERTKGETQYTWPEVLPDGRAVLFTTGPSVEAARIGILNLRTGEKRILLDGGSRARYAPTGHLVYAQAGSLFAVRFDAKRLQLTGSPVPVLEGVRASGIGYADYSFSSSGTLVYVPSAIQEADRTMVWVDRKGGVEALRAPPRVYANPGLSPDGQRIAVSIRGGSENPWDIWVYDLSRDTLTRLTFGRDNSSPVWTPNGQRVAFRAIPGGISWVPADRSGPAEQLVPTESPVTPGSWTPDGRSLLFSQGGPGATEIRVQAQPPGPSGSTGNESWRFLPAVNYMPQVSPDGQWIAYLSSESGIPQICVRPFPGPGGQTQISIDGGDSPRWARNGRELFYRNGDKMIAVDIETKPVFRAGQPKVLFEGRYEASPFGRQPGVGYDVSPDGKRFLMVRGAGERNAPAQLNVVQDWFEELKRRVP